MIIRLVTIFYDFETTESSNWSCEKKNTDIAQMKNLLSIFYG